MNPLQKYELDFPILLASEIAGTVEQWSKGMIWRLEQDGLYRILKRTVEILRSIPQAYQEVLIDVVEKAKEALVQPLPSIETMSREKQFHLNSREEITPLSVSSRCQLMNHRRS